MQLQPLFIFLDMFLLLLSLLMQSWTWVQFSKSNPYDRSEAYYIKK